MSAICTTNLIYLVFNTILVIIKTVSLTKTPHRKSLFQLFRLLEESPFLILNKSLFQLSSKVFILTISTLTRVTNFNYQQKPISTPTKSFHF